MLLPLEKVMFEVMSFDVRRSFLFMFLFFSNENISIKNFPIEIFLCSFSLLCIDFTMPVVIHGFSSSCGKPLF